MTCPLLRRFRPAWLLCGLGLLLQLAALLPAAAQTVELRSALTTPALSPASAFPASAPATLAALPDDWAQSRPARRGPQWYRVHLPPLAELAADDLPALFIERACSSVEVYLDGQLLHTSGPMREPIAGNCNLPLLVPLPTALLRRAGNTLDLKLAGYPLDEVGSHDRAGGLSALSFGPQSVLADRWTSRIALQVWAPQAISATLLLMGGFMFVLGFVNRRESHLAYFGALSVAWALHDTRLWWPSIPLVALGHAGAEFLLCMLLAVITWAAVQFLLRYARMRYGWVDRALPLQCALMALTLWLAGPTRLHLVATAWFPLLSLEVLAAAFWHLRRLWPAPSVWLMAGLIGAATLTGAIEFAAQWTGTRPLALHLARLAMPVLFVLTGLRLVQQHGRALFHAEQGKAQLELRVREATAEIERNFRQLAELRVEQVTERERKRIAADLHDDLGAKLLTIVHTSDSERISTLAREALEEMRLSVRGLTGKPVRLADALGDWRAEVVSRLAQAGIDGEWDAPEDLPQTLSARAYVQTTRILREATSNIIKHSRAAHCTVSAGISDGYFQLLVQDDGEGIAHEIDGRLDRGHGLASMKNRAKQLQGQCLVESGPGYGTVIRLTLPLDRAIEAV